MINVAIASKPTNQIPMSMGFMSRRYLFSIFLRFFRNSSFWTLYFDFGFTFEYPNIIDLRFIILNVMTCGWIKTCFDKKQIGNGFVPFTNKDKVQIFVFEYFNLAMPQFLFEIINRPLVVDPLQVFIRIAEPLPQFLFSLSKPVPRFV